MIDNPENFELETNLHKRGTIVTLISRPFTENNQSVVIAGEPNLIPPLMIVVETIFDNKSVFDENTGVLLAGKGIWQSRCIWFSHKTYQIEEAWLSSKLLKVISIASDCEEPTLQNIKSAGALVTLKTITLESTKLKISLSQKGNIKDEKSKITSALLSFVPPVMQVIGTVKFESKEPLFDPKTNVRKRFVPSVLVKCKYYNLASDKMSEVLIPIEALNLIPKVDSTRIEYLQSIINNSKNLVKVENRKSAKIEQVRIFQLKRITNKFGIYFIEFYDYFSDKVDEMRIEDDTKFTEISLPTLFLPKYTPVGNNLEVTSVNKDSIESLLEGLDIGHIYLRITYIDQFENKTTRIINDWQFINQRIDADAPDTTVHILKAFCFLRKDVRYFSIGGIRKIEVIDKSKILIDPAILSVESISNQ